MDGRLHHGAGDRELVEAVSHSGDEGAFRALYRRHVPRLYQFALRLTGGREADAEDIVQETWIRACRGLSGFRWESQFSSWLLAIGLRTARDHQRRAGRDRAEANGQLPDVPAPAPPIDARLDLEGAILRLPQGYRQVLILHDVEGMTHREIAQGLGIAEGTSKSQLFQARRLLRKYLGGTEDLEYA